MGFLNDLRKLFFGAESVTKSAANKAVDKSKELATDGIDKVQDVAETTGTVIKEKTAGLRDAIFEKSADTIESTKEAIGDTVDQIKESEVVQKTADFTENVGDKILDAGEATFEKVKDVTEDVGEVVMDKGGEIADKAKDIAENVGDKIMDVKDDLVEKAKEITQGLGDKLDETIEKAQEMERMEAAQPKSEFASEPIDTEDSLLDGTDDFFAKADRYASGDYGAFSEGKTTINTPDDTGISSKPPSIAAGFEDLDGDGNEVVDDAIIIESEEE